jgi:acyl-CoA dehydrogenase
MSWDFSTDDAYQAQLDWVTRFVQAEVEPLDLVLGHPSNVRDPRRNALVRPLQAQVRERKLWACHLGPELGGQGYGQVKLALLNEILGRSQYGPTVFGCQAPDSGNAEIEIKNRIAKFLRVLFAKRIGGCRVAFFDQRFDIVGRRGVCGAGGRQ